MSAVLITGAGRGLGLEFVRQYAAEGARVFACVRDPVRSEELNRLAAGSAGRVTIHLLDVTDEAAVATLAHALREEAIDILINNAGIDGTMSEGRLDYSAWEEVFRVNTMAPYRIARAFHGHLKKSQAARVVAISSRLGSIAEATGYAMDYGSTKAALNYVMHCLAAQYRKDGFIVITFNPGWVRTDMGGDDAPLTPRESIAGMRRQIARLKPSDSGRFLDYLGQEMPW